MSTRPKLFKQFILLVILPILIGAASFVFLSSDYLRGWRYDRPLRAALEKGDYASVKYRVKQGGDVNLCTIENRSGAFSSPLLLAIQHRDVVAARKFIRKGAIVGFPPPCWTSKGQQIFSNGPDSFPLWEAIKNGYEPMIKLLLNSGSNLNEQVGPHGFTISEIAYHECDRKPTPKCRRTLELIKLYWKPLYRYALRDK